MQLNKGLLSSCLVTGAVPVTWNTVVKQKSLGCLYSWSYGLEAREQRKVILIPK